MRSSSVARGSGLAKGFWRSENSAVARGQTIQVSSRAPVARRHWMGISQQREQSGLERWVRRSYIVAVVDGNERVADVALALELVCRAEDRTLSESWECQGVADGGAVAAAVEDGGVAGFAAGHSGAGPEDLEPLREERF